MGWDGIGRIGRLEELMFAILDGGLGRQVNGLVEGCQDVATKNQQNSSLHSRPLFHLPTYLIRAFTLPQILAKASRSSLQAERIACLKHFLQVQYQL